MKRATRRRQQVVRGRFHLDGWRLAYSAPLSWLRIWAPSVSVHPLVRAFFDAPDIALPSSTDECSLMPHSPEIRCHDLQAIVSVPGSSTQSWHADNSSRGLTVIMALSDITPTHGPTQIWPYAHSGAVVHAVRHGPLPSACVADGDGLGVQGTNATFPTLHAGDALVFDARMLHRGLANRSDDLRPVIVWQFTNVATPPPGQGAVVSLTKHAYMRILEALHAGLKRIEGGK